jgi:hypothetical protein
MTAPWQVNWQAYDVPRIADVVRPDPHERDVIPGARAVGDLATHAADLVLRAVGKLEKSWSDKSDAAAEAYAYARALAASLRADADAYHQIAADVGRIVEEIDRARREIEPLTREWEGLGDSATATVASLGTAAQDLNRRARNTMGTMDQAVGQMAVKTPQPYNPKILPTSGSGSGHTGQSGRVDQPHREPRTGRDGENQFGQHGGGGSSGHGGGAGRIIAGGIVAGALFTAGAIIAPRVGYRPPPAIPGVPATTSRSGSAPDGDGKQTAAEALHERADEHIYEGAYDSSPDGSADASYGGPGPTLTGGGPAMTPMTPGAPVSMMPLGMNSGMAPGGGAFILPGPGVGGGGVLRKATMSWSAAPAPETGRVIDGSRGGQLADWASGLPKPEATPPGTPTWQVARGGPGIIAPGSVLGPGARQAEEERALKKWYADLAAPWRATGDS